MEIISAIESLINSDDDDQDEFSCDNARFDKLKYISFTEKEVNYIDEYEYGVISDKIFLQIQFKLSAVKTTNFRYSTQILTFLGDVGGFKGALSLLVEGLGTFFSAHLFLASITNKLYLQ